MTAIGKNEMIFHEPDKGKWLRYRKPEAIISTYNTSEVFNKLAEVDQAVQTGLYAAGFVTYEAAAGLDSAFHVHKTEGLPLVWFGLYRSMDTLDTLEETITEKYSIGTWAPCVSQPSYDRAIEKVKEYIAAGDTYQVNYTLHLRAEFSGNCWAFFQQLMQAQPKSFGAYVDLDDYVICSASPELFFSLDGETLVSKPMKGTAPRGLTLQEDREQKQWLETSKKNRAENTMIVDMIRNDMGRIATPGSVAVSSLFEVEQYPTVFQMTTTVKSQTKSSFSEIMRAMFPCASITGTPKIRTMQIIHELEPEPRGIYTGCIGYFAPGRQAKFNVAIRTVTIDRNKAQAEYGVGGGIVWDSSIKEEYTECQIKALVLTTKRPKFDLLESLLWDGPDNYFLLERHLTRLAESAEYFDFAVNIADVRQQLMAFGEKIGNERHKVRLCVDCCGKIYIESSPIHPQPADRLWRLGLAIEPIDPNNPFLYHKTTHREMYNSAQSHCDAIDDVLLWNKHGEVTETKIGNIVAQFDKKFYTPTINSGLLAGVFRAELLARSEITERVIQREELSHADKLFVINSVRKWLPAVVNK
jgi:para-aminobenzoate synthetase/4-amino-4-deoxychorismate lyase